MRWPRPLENLGSSISAGGRYVVWNGDEVDHNHQLSGVSGNGKTVVFSSMGSFTGSSDDGNDFDVFTRSPMK